MNAKGRQKKQGQAATDNGTLTLAQRAKRGERVRTRAQRATEDARQVGMSFWNLNGEVSKTEQNRIRKQALAEMASELNVAEADLRVDLRLAEAIRWVRSHCGNNAVKIILSGKCGLAQDQAARLNGMASEKIRKKLGLATDGAE